MTSRNKPSSRMTISSLRLAISASMWRLRSCSTDVLPHQWHEKRERQTEARPRDDATTARFHQRVTREDRGGDDEKCCDCHVYSLQFLCAPNDTSRSTPRPFRRNANRLGVCGLREIPRLP